MTITLIVGNGGVNEFAPEFDDFCNLGDPPGRQRHCAFMRSASIIIGFFLSLGACDQSPRPDPSPRENTGEKDPNEKDNSAAQAAALVAIRAEPKVLDVAWEGSSLWAGVADDGTRRDGYAAYLCEVVREHKATPVVISVKNIESGETLGRNNCR